MCDLLRSFVTVCVYVLWCMGGRLQGRTCVVSRLLASSEVASKELENEFVQHVLACYKERHDLAVQFLHELMMQVSSLIFMGFSVCSWSTLIFFGGVLVSAHVPVVFRAISYHRRAHMRICLHGVLIISGAR